ncbi:MAG: hypothetical protein A3I12_02080 [Gammaproteobacteria bacterium RIFCSPLOWO2_02_FULL_38_11]|nr:MAG: hypothetical protein A3B69_04680 [Gammaproteobacteria bacterium RIFCSPHIGHO2_02_FULL_38_33]OGT23375.1 MAG: hypothetical protein A2W47_04085 [Gammaproteobacteria bacterium RIFCSPHIGHO2_12_38_15]OGT66830.1 MAG: hypothetical protein A3I12_02080 [Gammaproteobacteria bacterium RIFCSPLOWO2_02_FULL_38_11]OGT75945.1 MAG: hypothetical protein A3G71_04455 [Gammaproteobacteria bacterium RIFCSPLOWO2_12_FULL_38_14]
MLRFFLGVGILSLPLLTEADSTNLQPNLLMGAQVYCCYPNLTLQVNTSLVSYNAATCRGTYYSGINGGTGSNVALPPIAGGFSTSGTQVMNYCVNVNVVGVNHSSTLSCGWAIPTEQGGCPPTRPVSFN